MARRLPRKDVVIVGLGWTGSILAYELAHAGLDVVAIERGPWRDTATDFNIGTAPDELRYAVRHDIFLRPKQETLTMRNNPIADSVADPQMGQLPAGQWRRRRRRALERPDLAFSAGRFSHPQPHDRALRRGDPARRTITFRTGRSAMTSSNPITTSSSIVAGISGKAGNIKGQIQPGGNPFEGARERDYPTPPLRQGYAQELFTKAASGTGPASVSAAVRQHLGRLYQSLRMQHGALHLLRLLRTVRLRQLFQGLAADLRIAGAGPRADFRGAHRMRSDQSQPVRRRQDRHGRHLCRSSTARNGSSRPTSCWSAPMRCSMCGCCCCRASASPTIPPRTRAWSGATTPTRPAPARRRSSRRPSSIRSRPRVRSASRRTTTTATISITGRTASSAAPRSPAPIPTAGRSAITRRRAARRPGAARGRRRSRTPTSASPTSARRAA